MSWLSKTAKKVGHSISKAYKKVTHNIGKGISELYHMPETILNTAKGVYNMVNQQGYMPALIGTLGGAYLGGPFGAMIGAQLGGQYAQNLWSDKQAMLANQWAIDTWNMQNLYNTPANQVARMREAGLNPNLFYSQGSAGNAGSISSYTPAEHDYGFQGVMNTLTAFAQLDNIKAQNSNLKAQTKNIKAQTYSTFAQASYQMAMVDYYNRYGRFPNQGTASTLIQSFEDLTGLSSHNIRAFRHWLWNEGLKGYGEKEQGKTYITSKL